MIKDIKNNKQEFIEDINPGRKQMMTPRKLFALDRIANIIKADKSEGDIVETGVYRGCTLIYLTTLFPEKIVWGFDSFEGFESFEEAKYKDLYQKAQKGHHTASIDIVKENLKRYNLDLSKIKLVKGFVRDTLPTCSINNIALLHIDVDTYSATLDVLYNLYDKVIKNGIIILDDFRVKGCYYAFIRFCEEYNIDPLLINPSTPELLNIKNWKHLDKTARKDLGGTWFRKKEFYQGK